ncbi:hypothetical protein D1BOALGB6SA_1818 [Olavius sp. associated proteobacterium Delta 1]|nr:hypothetical protein D1BOALGB6SA_1818 [Olavius sp. associated proteobacterium Delta 1]
MTGFAVGAGLAFFAGVLSAGVTFLTGVLVAGVTFFSGIPLAGVDIFKGLAAGGGFTFFAAVETGVPVGGGGLEMRNRSLHFLQLA